MASSDQSHSDEEVMRSAVVKSTDSVARPPVSSRGLEPSEQSDFLLRCRGEISSAEYVRRLRAKVAARRMKVTACTCPDWADLCPTHGSATNTGGSSK